MLEHELRAEHYSKTDHRNRLLPRLSDRTAGSVERKHQNISAILREAGFAFLDGYKPLSNYQKKLADAVLDRLRRMPSLQSTAERIGGELPKGVREAIARPDTVFVQPPEPMIRELHESRIGHKTMPSGFDFPERDARNRELGRLGEEFVIELERTTLAGRGRRDLAKRVEWVSETTGAGAGYDVRSFDPSGLELFIEVKTTNFGARFPFIISRREVGFSEETGYSYRLYRLFHFAREPKCFVREGPVKRWCSLEPRSFYARV
jgi:hypothetical protein